jgi:hypothetical protein
MKKGMESELEKNERIKLEDTQEQERKASFFIIGI